MRTLRTPSSAAITWCGLMPKAVIVAMAAALRRMSRRLIVMLLISSLPGYFGCAGSSCLFFLRAVIKFSIPPSVCAQPGGLNKVPWAARVPIVRRDSPLALKGIEARLQDELRGARGHPSLGLGPHPPLATLDLVGMGRFDHRRKGVSLSDREAFVLVMLDPKADGMDGIVAVILLGREGVPAGDEIAFDAFLRPGLAMHRFLHWRRGLRRPECRELFVFGAGCPDRQFQMTGAGEQGHLGILRRRPGDRPIGG